MLCFVFMQDHVVGRMPTEREKRYAFKHNTLSLLEKLEREGENINWTHVVDHVSNKVTCFSCET